MDVRGIGGFILRYVQRKFVHCAADSLFITNRFTLKRKIFGQIQTATRIEVRHETKVTVHINLNKAMCNLTIL